MNNNFNQLKVLTNGLIIIVLLFVLYILYTNISKNKRNNNNNGINNNIEDARNLESSSIDVSI